MIEKMSLEQFLQIRNQLSKLIGDYNNYYDIHKDDDDFDDDALQQKLDEQYLKVQSQLLEYDLSDIPFEAWEGVEIFSDENNIVDFSKTKANIDFDLVDCYGYVNFKGCSVRNLDKYGRFVNAKYFDEETIKTNQKLFLSDAFSDEFKEHYYSSSITISDLGSLSDEQLNELKQKDFQSHISYLDNNSSFIKIIGIDNVVQLYKRSPEEYDAVNKLINMNNRFGIVNESSNSPEYEELVQQLQRADVSELKDICFDYSRKKIINTRSWINPDYPELFVKENSDIFLVGVDVPDVVRNRYFNRRLIVQDLLDYPEIFNKFPVDYFMDYSYGISQLICDNFGMGKFQELVKEHTDVFSHISKSNDFYSLSKYLIIREDLESTFSNAVREYFLDFGIPFPMPDNFISINDGKTVYNVPDWISSMNFKFVDKLETNEDLLNYDDSTVVLNIDQADLLYNFGTSNIKRFEQETGFFTHKGNEWSSDLEMFRTFVSYFLMHNLRNLKQQGIDFNDGTLSYDEFLSQIANSLDHMRKHNVFLDVPSYDWLQGSFRENHPEIFMDVNAPSDLKDAFYKNNITPKYLCEHKDYINYLVDKNLSNTIDAKMKLALPGLVDDQGNSLPSYADFIGEYASRYGNENLLQLCSKYGDLLSNITIISLNDEIDSKHAIENELRNAVYNKIIKGKMDFSHVSDVSEFVNEHPEIFVDFDSLTNISQEERERLSTAFYNRKLTFDDIKKYPELVNLLGDKNLFVAFGNKDGRHQDGRIIIDSVNGGTQNQVSGKKYSDLELLEIFGNEKFLELCAKYGRYMEGISQHLNKDISIIDGKYVDLVHQGMDFGNGLSFEEISERIEGIIARECRLGNISYDPVDAPDFLKEKCPDLFIGEDAPEDLQKFFYHRGNNYPMSFEVLQKHKDWLPYLEGKSISTSLLRNHYLKAELIKYLELFGEEKGIKLGISRAETVKEMMRAHQVELMKSWYDKTGGKFIPDFVVMQNFRLEEADKFLASGSNWSKLMRIKSFANNPESRDAMLKLAYSFGAFDQDQRGFKKLQDLLTDLPKHLDTIDASYDYVMDNIDSHIDLLSQRGVFYHDRDIYGNISLNAPDMTPEEKEEAYNKMIEYVKFDTPTLNLFESLKKEKVDIDFSKPIFAQLYRRNDGGSYSLTINTQSYPKSTEAVRAILGEFSEIPILTPEKAHRLFGGFELKYNPDFREFLLSNMDLILNNPEYSTYVSSVQRQFADIKAINSNRVLTWDLAMSFVQTNKYTSVNVGNDRVAEVSAIAGYSQTDFDVLQQIFNYGKQRTFSSIPRIEASVEKTSGNYTYEMLRLDDPLAMAIGTLTDCCQELNNCAEVCMEHSMVDKNGRVFIIKDDQGNIIAQSWVWRNKDVLCFDNIEIPDKVFDRTIKEHPELGRGVFTDEVFEIYKQAAKNLIEADEEVYRELLESGRISQEQYDGLRLGKVTVGSGYNDIAGSLQRNAEIDRGAVSRPLPFEEPVKLSRSLYTKDSTTQFILEEREDRAEYDGDTLPVHSDDYVEYSNENFNQKSLLLLEKLEVVTKENPSYLDTSVREGADPAHLVSELAKNYGLNPETTRVVMNPNFAIIYDINGDKLKVGDLLFNTKVDNANQQMDIERQVAIQMGLAIEQIGLGKEIDVSELNTKQKEMYDKATGIIDEMDMERGVSHAK